MSERGGGLRPLSGGLLDSHEHVRVLREHLVERGGATLAVAHEEEVGDAAASSPWRRLGMLLRGCRALLGGPASQILHTAMICPPRATPGRGSFSRASWPAAPAGAAAQTRARPPKEPAPARGGRGQGGCCPRGPPACAGAGT